MKRIVDLNVPVVQVGIRAQSKEEADLIKNSKLIHTFYANEIRKNDNWKKEALAALSGDVYITIDADGLDPSVIPAVGTAEPGGLLWEETVDFLRRVIRKRNVVGIDVVEIAPRHGEIISEYTCAKLIYRLIGYLSLKK
jgi:agmatinase